MVEMNVISNRLVREVEMIDCVGVTFEKSRWERVLYFEVRYKKTKKT